MVKNFGKIYFSRLLPYPKYCRLVKYLKKKLTWHSFQNFIFRIIILKLTNISFSFLNSLTIQSSTKYFSSTTWLFIFSWTVIFTSKSNASTKCSTVWTLTNPTRVKTQKIWSVMSICDVKWSYRKARLVIALRCRLKQMEQYSAVTNCVTTKERLSRDLQVYSRRG